MVARIAYFGKLTDDQRRHQDHNYQNRFGAAIESQPGHILAALLENEDGERISLSIWESEGAMVEGGSRANAVPLLPGQRGEDIPSPARVEIWGVFGYRSSDRDASVKQPDRQ
jgi:hypothetical protein